MRGFQMKLDVIGNNIANVNTPGFKAGRIMFQDILSQTVGSATGPEAGAEGQGGINPRQIGLGATTGSIDTLHTPGSPQTTNVPTDLLINGDGFFVVEDAASGARYLTRAGNFTFDAQRYLVTSGGLRVLGINGEPIRLGSPEDGRITNWGISSDGTVTYELEDVEEPYSDQTIALVNIENPQGLEKVGNSLYIPTANADPFYDSQAALENAGDFQEPGAGGTGEIVTGMLEMSNVDLTNEFTEMIIAQRAFQANSRIITTSDEVLQELVNLKR